MILKYKGKKEYTDPQLRFVAEPGDLIEFHDDEAAALMEEHPRQFKNAEEGSDD